MSQRNRWLGVSLGLTVSLCASHQLSADREVTVDVRGQVFSQSDVQGIPHSPLDALVLAISGAQINVLFDELRINAEHRKALRKLRLRLTKTVFEKYVVAYSRSRKDGSYHLSTSPGEHLLCVGNFDARATGESFPVFVNGCVEVNILSTERQFRQDLYWGIGGLATGTN